jgi:hypothetical protein
MCKINVGEELEQGFMLLICDVNTAGNRGHNQYKRDTQGKGRRQLFKGKTDAK